MSYSSIITPKAANISVSHQHALGVANYDLDDLYSPDTDMWKSKVLDLASPKYSPNATYIFDKSRFGNHGTITGATWRQLPSGLAYLDFDGTDDYVTVTDAASLRPTSGITLLLWANVPSGVTSILISKEDVGASKKGYFFFVISDSLFVDIGDGTNRQRISNALTVADYNGKWGLYGATWDGAIQKGYFNGAVLGTTLSWSGSISYTADKDVFLAGDGVSEMRGLLTLPRILKRALSAEDWATTFNQERHLFGV